jgi:hypothetical protein
MGSLKQIRQESIIGSIWAPIYRLAKYLVGLLGPCLQKSKHHVNDSDDFILMLSTLHVKPNDILDSFDIISLFTKMPITDVLNFLSWQFDEDNIRLFHPVLTSLFCFNGQFYEHTDGVAMGSLLLPVISSFFMEDSEEGKRHTTGVTTRLCVGSIISMT